MANPAIDDLLLPKDRWGKSRCGAKFTLVPKVELEKDGGFVDVPELTCASRAMCLDIDGIHITLISEEKPVDKGKSKARSKAKSKAGLEILSNARLQLKEGRRYALVGRNGTGKSTLLRSIAEKLIPSIPEGTRVALLQQTRLVEAVDDRSSANEEGSGPTVLQAVIEKATSKSIIERDIKTLSKSTEKSDPYAALRALRSLNHERHQKDLFLLDKDARLRSGVRGLQARKALVAYEKVVAESKELLNQPSEDIPPETLQQETQGAADMLARLQEQVEPSIIAEAEARARSILRGLGFSTSQMASPISTLSGGWHMRAALASTLLEKADILILDEPTNFLDMLGIIWLERYLVSLGDSKKPPTIIVVSHDRDFQSLCTDLIIFKDKILTYFHGDLPTYETSQFERRQWLIKMKHAKDKQKALIEQTIATNLKDGKAKDDQNKIRQAKSRQKKLDNRWGLEVSAKGGRFKLNRDRGSLISLENVNFRYSTQSPVIIRDVNISIGMGDRIGILGLNGTGKSTLVQILVGAARETSGARFTHPRLRLGYYSQYGVEALQAIGQNEETLTPLLLLTREVNGEMTEGEIRGLLSQLGLPGRIASHVPICKLSGGQLMRSRRT
ncbi:hypothetical protein N8T08_002221 [Aspergillus melleus]|uniref:Uncharacterized protein n=1 Tax=Aspergillus melleus TaxID=138277 RepID=A0ACC3B967_9EURO|nr:hypothetical protein N8T08_002221 [Aspergillus melleus]